jgi:hypothetical protein
VARDGDDVVAQPREALALREHRRRQLGLDHQRARARVLDDVRELVDRRSPARRHGRAAEARGHRLHLDHLEPVVEDDDDGRAAPDAAARELARDAIDARIDLAVGQALTLVAQRERVRLSRAVDAEHGGEAQTAPQPLLDHRPRPAPVHAVREPGLCADAQSQEGELSDLVGLRQARRERGAARAHANRGGSLRRC